MTQLYMRHEGEKTGVGYSEPMACPLCRSMHFFWVNRYGRTLCTGCDAATYREEAA